MRRFKILFISLIFMLSGCVTPPEVKQLSLKQLEYLDVLSDAVAAQSDALISIAEQIKKQAETKITQHEQESIARLKVLVVKTIPTQGSSKREKTAEAILSQASDINKQAEKSRQKLERQFTKIKEKTEELQLYLQKIRDVQLTLDAYIQSTKAGEKVLAATLGHTTVDSLFGHINHYLPKIKQTTQDLQGMLKTLENK